MKATGIVRAVDDLGRYVIPKELRRTLNINSGDKVEVHLEGENIVIQRIQDRCIFCGEREVPVKRLDKPVCVECADDILDQMMMHTDAK